MKPKLLFAAMSLFIAGAHAQSSITMYGLVSAGIVRTNNVNGGSLTTLVNGPNQLSRLGFRGTEDLGGGYSAFFVLENGFNIDTGTFGQGGRAFGRASVVGLDAPRLGSIWLGRQNDVLADALCFYEAGCQFAGFGTHVGDNDNVFTTFRVNNAITYKSPQWNNFQLSLQYGAAESATDNKNNREYSGSLKYVNGDLSIGSAVLNVDRPNSATNQSGAVTLDYGFSSPFSSSRLSGAPVVQQKVKGLGASYRLVGDSLLSVLYTNSKFLYADTSRVSIKNSEISFSKNILPALQVGVGYFVTNAAYSHDLSERSWRQLNTGMIYWLSKRTDVSLMYLFQKAYGDGNKAWIYSQGKASGRTQSSIGIGIRHRF